ncbi:MAG: winged helix-turn-helix transcriptional regulator [Pseudomonadaceae bacterium]|nr:winged helix-turn-helix transcriptional regulator [Pseudomonadaceae bacterium]
MAHKGRLLVLCALGDAEHTAGELAALTGLTPSALSQHLARLREANLVTARTRHRHRVYTLASPHIRTLISTLKTIYCPR